MATSLKRTFLLTVGLALMVIVSACGGTSSTGSTQSTPTTAASTPTATATAISTPTATTTSTATIHTTQAKVNGKAETILTDGHGMTLYYYTPDSPTKVACIGECATAWPPLLSKGSGVPLANGSLPGKFTTLNGANGNQVEYNGHLLYTFIKDVAPGQVTGQGVGGKWFVATSTLAGQSGTNYIIQN